MRLAGEDFIGESFLLGKKGIPVGLLHPVHTNTGVKFQADSYRAKMADV